MKPTSGRIQKAKKIGINCMSQKRRKSTVAVETTVRVEKDQFKRPILILPPEIREGSYRLLAIDGDKLIIVLSEIIKKGSG